MSVNWSVPTNGCSGRKARFPARVLARSPLRRALPRPNIPLTVNECGANFLNSATLTLSGAVNGIIADPLTVIDVVGDGNLVTTPGLYIRGNTVDTTAGMAQVPVMLGGPTGQTSTSTVTVNYTTANGSAVSGTDYSAINGQLSFGPGQTEQTIFVPITDRTSAAQAGGFHGRLVEPVELVHRSVHGDSDHRGQRRDAGIVALYLRTCQHGDR